jgi:hypothetical protein
MRETGGMRALHRNGVSRSIEVLDGNTNLLVVPHRRGVGNQTEVVLHILNWDFSRVAEEASSNGRVRFFIPARLLAGIDRPRFDLFASGSVIEGNPTVRKSENRPGYIIEIPQLPASAVLRVTQ